MLLDIIGIYLSVPREVWGLVLVALALVVMQVRAAA
jgi:hypothetical protein